MTTILASDVRAFSTALGDLIRVVQFRDRDRACCYDLSVSQCHALDRVVHTGPLTVNELAAALYLDKSTTSRIANALVTRGLVERRPNPEDGRVVRLASTSEGRSVCGRIEQDLDTEYADLLADFDPEVQAAAANLVKRLGEAFARRVDASNGKCCSVSPLTGASR
jgi:DNA-binding MarR family transcriptional regulator